MKYSITPGTNGVIVELTSVGKKSCVLLTAFSRCQQGTCSCPTNEYEKLQSLSFEEKDDGITLNLHAKPEMHLNVKEIKKCLEFTMKQVTSQNGE